MAMTPRLDLRQSQSLVMTPQLQQAIKLLALSNVELEAFIGAEFERNPLLEAGSTLDASGDGGTEAPGEFEGPADAPAGPEASVDLAINQGQGGAEGPLDADFAAETFIDSGPGDGVPVEPSARGQAALSSTSGSATGEGGLDFDSFSAAEPGLHTLLLNQAGASFSGLRHIIAVQLIGQISPAGYLEADLLETAQRLGTPLVEVEAVLAVIQSFEPAGVGARSLSECLALQAREADRYDPAMATLINNLDLLARGQIAHLRRICGVDEDDMADMIRELRAYDPKPGLRFGGEPVHMITPDVLVRRHGDGWSVEINNDTLPRVLINRRYYSELGQSTSDKASKAWLAECMSSANWLVRALDQRQRTILKVAQEIVRCQDGFFRNGVTQLRPLTLRTVADAVGLHESTVSRVTSNKYLACPRGSYELKYFFTSAIQAADGGEAASAEAVKSHIATLIAEEAPTAILSDDMLVDLLRKRGFDIARRTVAKYREAIGLGSSVQRRRQKKMGG